MHRHAENRGWTGATLFLLLSVLFLVSLRLQAADEQRKVVITPETAHFIPDPACKRMKVRATFMIGFNPPVPAVEAVSQGIKSQTIPIIMRAENDPDGKDKEDAAITSITVKIEVKEGNKIKMESVVFNGAGSKKGLKVTVSAPNKWTITGDSSPSPVITMITVEGFFQKTGDKIIEIKNADIQVQGLPKIEPGSGSVDGTIIDPSPDKP